MSREVNTLLRLEGLAVLVAAVAVFWGLEGSWLFFVVLLLVPDVSMLGYLANPRVGALAYNAFHTYLGPALLGGIAWWTGQVGAGHVALVWAGHIGLDRALGFGLKYPTGFSDTHLGVSGGTGLPGSSHRGP